MGMKVGASLVTFFAVFAFFVVAICTLGGEQSGLNTRKFGDVNVGKSLTLDGGAPLKHDRVFTSATFSTLAATTSQALVTTPGGTTNYTLPPNAVVVELIVTSTQGVAAGAGVLTLGFGVNFQVGAGQNANSLGAGVPFTSLVTGGIVSLSPVAAGSPGFPFIPGNAPGVIAVQNEDPGPGNQLTAGALTVDVYYYQY